MHKEIIEIAVQRVLKNFNQAANLTNNAEQIAASIIEAVLAETADSEKMTFVARFCLILGSPAFELIMNNLRKFGGEGKVIHQLVDKKTMFWLLPKGVKLLLTVNMFIMNADESIDLNYWLAKLEVPHELTQQYLIEKMPELLENIE